MMGNRGSPRFNDFGFSSEPEKFQNFKCDVCNEEFRNKHKLLSHKRRHNVGEVIDYNETSNDGFDDPKKPKERCATGYKCEICGKVSISEGGLRVHKFSKHKDQRSVSSLPKETHSAGIAKDMARISEIPHQERTLIKIGDWNTNDGEFPCPKCGKAFVTELSLRLHQSKAHNPQSGRSKEKNCENGFKESSKTSSGENSIGCGAMEGTLKIQQQSDEFPCEKCGKKFPTRRGLQLHTVRLHSEHSNSDNSLAKSEFPKTTSEYSCKMCGKTLNTEKGLHLHNVKIHQNAHHKQIQSSPVIMNLLESGTTNRELPAEFNCEISGQEFKSTPALDVHQIPFENSNCENSSAKSKLRETTSTGDYSCKACGKILKTERGLHLHNVKIHQKAHHEQKQSSPVIMNLVENGTRNRELLAEFNCGICGQVFKSTCALDVHKLNVHEIACENSSVKCELRKTTSTGDYCCKTCGKIFNSEKGRHLHNVKTHQKAHHEQNQNQCSPVIKSENNNEITNRQLPTGFPCQVCGKDFKSAPALGLHKFNAHRIRRVLKQNRKKKIQRVQLEKEAQKVTTRNEEEFPDEKCDKKLPKEENGILDTAAQNSIEIEGSQSCLECSSGYRQQIYNCKLCTYTTKDGMNLVRHEKSHLTKEERKKLVRSWRIRHCKLCLYSTRDPSHLIKHLMQVHNLGKVKSCTECNYQTFSILKFRTHMKNKHKKKIRASPKKFNSFPDLQHHCWQHHEQSKSGADDKPPPEPIPQADVNHTPSNANHLSPGVYLPLPILYECQMCDKKFAAKSFLKRHINFVHVSKGGNEEKLDANSISEKKSDPNRNSEENSRLENQGEGTVIQKRGNEVHNFNPDDGKSNLSTQPKVQKYFFKTDRPELQCQFCFVDCWDAEALVNHLKRHR